MEALSASLKPYKNVVGSVATIVTIIQLFAGVLICRDIYRQKSTKGVSSIHFIGGVVLGILMLKYSMMLQDSAMYTVNVAGITLNLLYTLFYYLFSEDKANEIYRPLTYGGTLITVMLSYAIWEDPALIEWRYGFICTILMLMLLGAPLMEINEILQKEDSSSIPFPLTVMSTIVSFLWLIYGIIILNYFTIIHNVIGLLLCFVQLTLYFMFPKVDDEEMFDNHFPGLQRNMYHSYRPKFE